MMPRERLLICRGGSGEEVGSGRLRRPFALKQEDTMSRSSGLSLLDTFRASHA